MSKHSLYALSCIVLMIVVVFSASINTEAVSPSSSHLNILMGKTLAKLK